jgi:hypothetical protein
MRRGRLNKWRDENPDTYPDLRGANPQLRGVPAKAQRKGRKATCTSAAEQ